MGEKIIILGQSSGQKTHRAIVCFSDDITPELARAFYQKIYLCPMRDEMEQNDIANNGDFSGDNYSQDMPADIVDEFINMLRNVRELAE